MFVVNVDKPTRITRYVLLYTFHKWEVYYWPM